MKPSTAVPDKQNDVDERKAFEAWYGGDSAPSHAFELTSSGHYKYMATQSAWHAWEASAKIKR